MRQSSTVDATPIRPVVFQVRAIIVTGPLLVDLHVEPEAKPVTFFRGIIYEGMQSLRKSRNIRSHSVYTA